MQLKESGEMYLESIYVLSKDHPYVRSIDVGEYLGYSKPSVSRAMGLLKDGGYVAEKTYERHTVLTALFRKLGVDEKIAAADACKIEHVISDETFAAIKHHAKKMENMANK